ncbi:TPA: lipid asymmetry maintenance protein MlaB [Haemophilus influenzae]|uniref:STAS domain-containing protein n=1 Tax=Haemophilus influenzae TaxID=727 RepID=UPI0005BE9EF2|nr:lipid asymmetry maintenance protein MlaB [Haemophilus influenzae]AJO87687.1 putative NTP binding protein (contains STAS domain) [Haemophilus influenzae]AWP54727.1 STAS domain-containing protein [Haemophilus influenzae]PRI39459.1 STAS domain protein [Haemophilus influenzae]PRI45701.1 STAS domain protein [Haemophilus influenzae]PRI89206.1 STAS domain protein [Haemophilus influenzae]
MLNWDLQKNNDKITLFLFGELSRCTLLPMWQQRGVFLSASTLDKTIVEWNLSDLQHIDSAGFAALCDFLRECQKINKTVRLVYPPKQLLTLADLFGLSDWIANFT